MIQRDNIEEKLQDLIDGNLSEQEEIQLKLQIQEDKNLILLYSMFKEVDDSLQDIDLQHPSEEFTSKVMRSLHAEPERRFDFKSILIFIGLIVCAVVGLIYASQVSMELPQTNAIRTEVPVSDKFEINIPSFNLPSSEVLLNIFYFSLLFLALIYFDRVILRQLFKSKKFSA